MANVCQQCAQSVQSRGSRKAEIKSIIGRLTVDDITQLLNYNNQYIPVLTDNLYVIDLMTNMMTKGALGRCSQCLQGSLYLIRSSFDCIQCGYSTLDPARIDFKIPDDMVASNQSLAQYVQWSREWSQQEAQVANVQQALVPVQQQLLPQQQALPYGGPQPLQPAVQNHGQLVGNFLGLAAPFIEAGRAFNFSHFSSNSATGSMSATQLQIRPN